MIILRKEYIYNKPKRPELESPRVIDVVLVKKDTGVSFADILGECEIEGHVLTTEEKYTFNNKWVPEYTDWVERCSVCEMERDYREYRFKNICVKNGNKITYHPLIKYGEWRPSPCYECEENCIISQPLENFNCQKCGNSNEISDSSLVHTGRDDILLFNCGICGTQDQPIIAQ